MTWHEQRWQKSLSKFLNANGWIGEDGFRETGYR